MKDYVEVPAVWISSAGLFAENVRRLGSGVGERFTAATGGRGLGSGGGGVKAACGPLARWSRCDERVAAAARTRIGGLRMVHICPQGSTMNEYVSVSTGRLSWPLTCGSA